MPKDIQFILYNLPEKEGKVQVIIRDETLWCTQKAMAQLFGVDRTVVSKHLRNIFESSELQQETLKRLPEGMRAAYELFRQNLERKV